MILFRLHYHTVTVPLQFSGFRYRTLPFLDQRYPRQPCVTDRDINVTKRYPTLHALPNVTERYRALQNVTERNKRYRALHTEFMDFGEFK
jgi:hypothetical protein